MCSFSPKEKLPTLMVGNVMNLPVTPKIVRARGKMQALFDVTSIRRRKLQRRACVHMLLNAGVRRLLRSQRRPKILLPRGRSLSCPTSFLQNPVIPQDWKMAETPAKFSILVVAYSGWILALWNQDQNAPRNAQERNATGIRWLEWYY